MAIKKSLLLVILVLSLPVYGAAQTAQEVNESNNPLTPKLGVNLQDQYISSYFGLPDGESNAILLRSTLPHKLFGWPQIMRATMPIVTSPDVPLDETTGLGDINVFDLLLFKAGPLELGEGHLAPKREARSQVEAWQQGIIHLHDRQRMRLTYWDPGEHFSLDEFDVFVAGYKVFTIVDASGNWSKMATDLTLARVVQAGAIPIDT